MNPLRALAAHGQSAWLDFIERDFVRGGALAALVTNDGVSGVTSNPAIFEKAIASGGGAYADAIARGAPAATSAAALFEQLAIDDVRAAADVLMPVYTATHALDGYVSLEVSPTLANDTQASIEDARRLWAAVDRPNLMIKIPGTTAGARATEALIADGINVNVTLLFSLAAYRASAQAYQRGIERRLAAGKPVDRVASVASFFVSRIDSRIDPMLKELAARAPEAAALRARAAIANARLAYQAFEHDLAGAAWQALAARGAQPQRLLWASTSTKAADLSDVLYVEELIGPMTVNTLPPATLDAFRDHGRARAALAEGATEATACMATLARLGIDFDAVTDALLAEGIALFQQAYDTLLGAVARAAVAACPTSPLAAVRPT